MCTLMCAKTILKLPTQLKRFHNSISKRLKSVQLSFIKCNAIVDYCVLLKHSTTHSIINSVCIVSEKFRNFSFIMSIY